MPYPEKFTHALQGIAHGMKPTSASLRKISPQRARELLAEAGEAATKTAQKGVFAKKARG